MPDDFEEEFTDDDLRELHRMAQEAALRSYPNPERTGCPGSRVLEEVANARAPFHHPAYKHIKRCSPCLTELVEMRNAKAKALHQSGPRPLEQVGAFEGRTPNSSWFARPWRTPILILGMLLAVLLLVVVFFLWNPVPGRPFAAQQSAYLNRNIDLWDKDPSRGETPIEAESLPTALLRVTIILPRFSRSGQYTIAVTSDRYGRDVVAKAIGSVKGDGPKEVMTLTLDLRAAKPGTYFLQTTRDGDASSYFYPLTIE
jgi:hypothetical protein